MTSMPQMVALLNGFGGGASLTIALAEYYTKLGQAPTSFADILTPVVATSASAFGQGARGHYRAGIHWPDSADWCGDSDR